MLPRFYYRKKTWHFFGWFLVTIVVVILVEELVLEQIFFPVERGQTFGGTLLTLAQVLPVIIILTGVKFAWDALIKQRELDQLKAAIEESQLQMLKSQINPHFLFNNLNNLYSYAIDNSPKTPQIILELSGMLRYMLYECQEKYVALEKEVEHLKNFMKISEMQIEERGTVNFKSENIKPNYRIAPLILSVFVENAFKHSTASQADDINIDVALELSDTGMLNFECKNTYLTQSNTNSLSKGIGLENVKKRLQLIYPDDYELKLGKSEDLFVVNLSIQLNKEV